MWVKLHYNILFLCGWLIWIWEFVMDRESWRAAIHGAAKSWTRLSDWTEYGFISLIYLKKIWPHCAICGILVSPLGIEPVPHDVKVQGLNCWTTRESEVAQSCPTLCDPMDCSLPGSSIHGIFQARILEWVAISFSRRSSRPRDWTWISCIVGRCFTVWATREVPFKSVFCYRGPSQELRRVEEKNVFLHWYNLHKSLTDCLKLASTLSQEIRG